MTQNLPQTLNNFIAIDNEQKCITVNLDHPGEVWSVVMNAPETNVEMNFKTLRINTTEDLSLQTGDGHYLLLNTTREQYEWWLANGPKEAAKLQGKCTCALEAKDGISSNALI
jgi:hypothetical protein